MNRKEIFEAWKNRRKDVDVDADFTDRVMRQVFASEEGQRDDVRPTNRTSKVSSIREWGIPTMTALLLVSLTVGLLRFGSIIVLLILMSSTGY